MGAFPLRTLTHHKLRQAAGAARPFTTGSFCGNADGGGGVRSLLPAWKLKDQIVKEEPFGVAVSKGIASCPRPDMERMEGPKGMYIRVDMSGLGKEDVQVWLVTDDTLVFQGRDEREKRIYDYRVLLRRNVFKTNEIKVEMKNGVLKIVVPKTKECYDCLDEIKLAVAHPYTTGAFRSGGVSGPFFPSWNLEDQMLVDGPFGAAVSRGIASCPRMDYSQWFDDSGLYIRVDMPGLGKEDVEVWVEDSWIAFRAGFGQESGEGVENERTYDHWFKLGRFMFVKEEVKAEMTNCVLRIVLPKERASIGSHSEDSDSEELVKLL